MPVTRALSLAALCVLFAAPAVAQATGGDPRKQELVSDPAVRASLAPQTTPLGRSPPQQHAGKADSELQTAMDAAHRGSTGITRPTGTRSPGNQAPGQKDGDAPRQTVPAK